MSSSSQQENLFEDGKSDSLVQAPPVPPPVPLHYTRSVDYRTDLQKERDENYDLLQQLNKLKEANIKQSMQLENLKLVEEQNAAMWSINKQARQDISDLIKELEQHRDAANELASLQGKMLEMQTELNTQIQHTKTMGLMMAMLEAEKNHLQRQKQHYFQLHLAADKELVELRRYQIDAQHRLSQLEQEFGRMDFIRDRLPNGELLNTTNDYYKLITFYINQNQQLHKTNTEVMEIHKETVAKCNSYESEIARLKAHAAKLESAATDRGQLESKLAQLTANDFAWKVKTEEEINRKLAEKLEEVTSQYQHIVNIKNQQLQSLCEILELKREGFSQEQLKILDEVMKNLHR